MSLFKEQLMIFDENSIEKKIQTKNTFNNLMKLKELFLNLKKSTTLHSNKY